MLTGRQNSIDEMLRTIAIMVECTEVSGMMDKIQTLMRDRAMLAS